MNDSGVTRRGLILFALLGVAWGIPYLLIKIAVGQLDPAMLVFARMGLAAAVLLPVAAVRGDLAPVLRRWRPLLAFTLVEIIVPQFMLSWAEERLPSSTTGLLIAAVPLAGVGVAFLLGRPERLAPLNWLGIALGMAGVAALVGFAVSGSDLGAFGEVLLVVVGYALGPAILAKWMPGLPGTGIMAIGFTLTTAAYAPVVAATHGWPAAWPSASVIVSLVLLAIVCSAGAFTIMAALVAEVGPVRATTVTYVNPAVALIAGAVVLGEPVTAWAVAGFALILAGCYLVATRRTRPGAPRRDRRPGERAGHRGLHALTPWPDNGPVSQEPHATGTPAAADRTPPDYRGAARAGIGVLQRWYSPRTGLWKSTGWWNAANALTAVISYTRHTGDESYLGVIETTFTAAQRKHARFVNKFFDDNGWWALAWVAAYDLTGDRRYLAAAQAVFTHNLRGWDGACGGGLWWNEDRRYKNAITNELFVTLAALLAARVPSGTDYRDWALRAWDWLDASGMIGPGGLVNDGLNAACQNNQGITWTYNQGVILGGLAALYELTGEEGYLRHGEVIADAALGRLTGERGILAEPCEPSGCDGDQTQFKGIFVRYLHRFALHRGKPAYRAFLLANADSVLGHARNRAGQFGLRWAGPFDKADASRQTSAVEVLIAAAALAA